MLRGNSRLAGVFYSAVLVIAAVAGLIVYPASSIGYGGGYGYVALVGLTLSKSVVAGCLSVTGTLILSEPAPFGGLVVTISDNLTAASTPATVTVPEGYTSKTFKITTLPVSASQTGNIRGWLSGSTQAASLTIRPIALSSISLTPSTVVGGSPVVGKATLECKAAPGPIQVDLGSSNPSIASPLASPMYVQQGIQSATFDVTTTPVLASTSATIIGTANSITKSKTLSVKVAASVTPTSLKFGSVKVGVVSPQLNVTLYNKGVAPFFVNGLSITGTYASWFAFTDDCPDSLPAGGSCTIGVTFKPQTATSRSASLKIATSATSTPLTVSLSGSGIL